MLKRFYNDEWNQLQDFDFGIIEFYTLQISLYIRYAHINHVSVLFNNFTYNSIAWRDLHKRSSMVVHLESFYIKRIR